MILIYYFRSGCRLKRRDIFVEKLGPNGVFSKNEKTSLFYMMAKLWTMVLSRHLMLPKHQNVA
jgi:hypothetical protein